ncbi:M56 family metallopeptidase [Evansella tamaricis]|uniref:M48 family metalloprotease n=1 Tax=Evansella tamaricis TaxID=2069301 RepID=A0ABS6JKF3_9BACI|nr:M56 family metallopeptidase [Evansella tamaricis]MBU9713865.1 M48 family metalloprotease [Evansella tamaricis]
MFPSFTEAVLYLGFGFIICMAGAFWELKNKKVRLIIEIILATFVLIYLFTTTAFLDSFIYLFFLASGYSSYHSITEGKKKTVEIKKKLLDQKSEGADNTDSVPLFRDSKRILVEIGITCIVLSGAILFLVYGPEYSILKLFILIAFSTILPELVKRAFSYQTVKVYYSNSHVYIVSRYESREIPLEDIKEVRKESDVDLLKLHPMLTFLSSNTDFTTGFRKVVCLRLLGESLYLTVEDVDEWVDTIEEKCSIVAEWGVLANPSSIVEVLPFYHWKNIKRLFGKLYFAMTVKGIAAYTGLFLILYYAHSPEWVIVIVILLFWIFNLYISDRVLITAMDAKEVRDTEVIESAHQIFTKAGIPEVKVYETESQEYNGLAIGMGIGKSMVTLTTATRKLPLADVEAILAHEAIHVKKRDVLWGQLLRLPYMLLLLGVGLFLFYYVPNLDDYKIPLFFLMWVVIMFYPIYQAFFLQWMEVRADHQGAELLENGREQMANGLTSLGQKQDEAVSKIMQHRYSKEEQKENVSSLERSSWLFRFMEFLFLPHPPLYWRIRTLRDSDVGWKNGIIKRWMIDRVREILSK